IRTTKWSPAPPPSAVRRNKVHKSLSITRLMAALRAKLCGRGNADIMRRALRRAEGEEAAKFLGITPVGWSLRPARQIWQDMGRVYEEVEALIARHKIDQL